MVSSAGVCAALQSRRPAEFDERNSVRLLSKWEDLGHLSFRKIQMCYNDTKKYVMSQHKVTGLMLVYRVLPRESVCDTHALMTLPSVSLGVFNYFTLKIKTVKFPNKKNKIK